VRNYKTALNDVPLLYRSDSKERMDDQQVDKETISQTHQQLKSINGCTFGYWPTMSAVKYFLGRYGSQGKIKILDIGCGDGETLRRIDDFRRMGDFSLELTGIDLNREVIATALELTASHINFIHGDILAHDGDVTYDVIINSLTMHHLSNEEIVKLVQWMSDRACIGWFISDLHRHWIAYYFIKYFVKLCRFNHLVCHDAPLSVARGFRHAEWIELLTQAGINFDRVKISWWPNFRYGILYDKSL
jgi:2-polyprenyl-3-methyl-5-hydroxy-6-metoxy-1,4-benzoquinol methylase